MNEKKNVLLIILRILLNLLVLGLDAFLLIRFEYLGNLTAVDNILGMIPLTLMFIFTVASSILIWIPIKKEKIYFPILMASWMVICAALFPNSLSNNWFFGKEIKSVGSDGDISAYEPFKPDTKAVKLDESSTLTIESDMPVMDGALALYPVYSAVAQATYSQANYIDEVRFTNTIRGFNSLVSGDVDIFFSAYPSDNQMEYAKKEGKELVFTPIGKEAFCFIVPKSNPIDNLTTQQIRNIYSGKTSMWNTLGWKEGGRMIKFQRPEGSGSQSTLQKIMKGLPIEAPQPAPNMDIIGTNSLMKQMTVEYNGVQPALGYSYKFFATTMNPNPDTKFLSINGIAPTSENITNDSYPYVAKFFAITVGEPKGNTKKVIDWIRSPQGQYIINKTGYASFQ